MPTPGVNESRANVLYVFTRKMKTRHLRWEIVYQRTSRAEVGQSYASETMAPGRAIFLGRFSLTTTIFSAESVPEHSSSLQAETGTFLNISSLVIIDILARLSQHTFKNTF